MSSMMNFLRILSARGLSTRSSLISFSTCNLSVYTRRIAINAPSRLCSSKKLNFNAVSPQITEKLISRNSHTDSNMSGEIAADRNLDYKSVIERKNNGVKLIDVREKKELLEDGTIPGSYHIPVGELANALTNMKGEDFKAKYEFEKPAPHEELIFSCRSGKRSMMAYNFAEKAGYTNIYNYAGGWLDWEKNAGKA